MTGFQLKAGATINLLTQDELDGSLRSDRESEWSERARGLKPMRFWGAPQAAVSATAGYTINATPSEGYIWNVRLLAAGFTTSQTARFYIGTDTNTGIPTPSTLPPVASGATGTISQAGLSKGQLLMRPADYLVISAGASATLNSYLMTVVEVPSELVWKVV